MSQIIHAHFDGIAIIPDEPLNLAPGRRVRIQIETVEEDAYPLTQISGYETDMGVTDLAEKHSDYARRRAV